MSTPAPTDPRRIVTLGPSDLVGHGAIACPNPRTPAWSSHPRVFLDVGTTGAVRCPYCGTDYQLAGGPAHGSGH